MPNDFKEIKECRLILMVGDNENPENAFYAQIFPDGKAKIKGDSYYAPLVKHILGEVMPAIVNGKTKVEEAPCSTH